MKVNDSSYCDSETEETLGVGNVSFSSVSAQFESFHSTGSSAGTLR